MKKNTARIRRIGDQIQRELGEILREQVKDPRIGFVTIIGVDVANDLAHAKVYFTHMAGMGKAEEAEKSLARTAGFLRSEIAHRLSSHTVPQLHFIYDTSIEHGMKMSQLIDDAVALENPDNRESDEVQN
jgi:ribosome-binding factor A